MGKAEVSAYVGIVFGAISAALGSLSVPVLLMILCNIMDYATGIMASHHRGEVISSYKGIDGISKKVCMWLLVAVGAVIDKLLLYYTDSFGAHLPFKTLVACIVCIWIICNEIISILENVTDMGVAVPKFLKPIIEYIKSQVEESADPDHDDKEE